MKEILFKIIEEKKDFVLSISKFYREKHELGFDGVFSTYAAEKYPEEWVKAIESGTWNENGVYGDNFRKVFNLKIKK